MSKASGEPVSIGIVSCLGIRLCVAPCLSFVRFSVQFKEPLYYVLKAEFGHQDNLLVEVLCAAPKKIPYWSHQRCSLVNLGVPLQYYRPYCISYMYFHKHHQLSNQHPTNTRQPPPPPPHISNFQGYSLIAYRRTSRVRRLLIGHGRVHYRTP